MSEKLPLFRLKELKQRRRRFRLLKDWYGTDYASTEMAAHTHQPEAVKEVMDRLLKSIDSPENNLFLQISARWQEIAGPQLSRLTAPQKLEGGCLNLEVRHSALLRELAPSLDLILKRVHSCIPGADARCREAKLVIAGGGRLLRERR